jgi:hypothetical protein
MRLRVMKHHRVEERRGLIGTVVARYGVGEYVAMDGRLAEGRFRMFWPMDLEEIPYPPQAWWRFLSGGEASG